jgi:hypothetical protein
MCFQCSIYLLFARMEAHRQELDAAEWHAAPVDKAGDVVERTPWWANGPMEEGWPAMALERGRERGRRQSGAVESAAVVWSRRSTRAMESAAAAWSRWSPRVVLRTQRSYGELRGTDDSRADKVGASEDTSGELAIGLVS